jgi:hypothetical protein
MDHRKVLIDRNPAFASLVAAALLAACRFFLPIPFGSSSFNWLVGDLRGKLPLNKQAGNDDRWYIKPGP